MTEWLAGISVSVMTAILTIFGITIKRAHDRIDAMQEKSIEYVTRKDLAEKLEDKLEVVKQKQEQLAEDLKEIKEIVKEFAK